MSWVYPAGSRTGPDSEVVVDDSLPGWHHTGLRVIALRTGQDHETAPGAWEVVVVPLNGPVLVEVHDATGARHTRRLTGRADVWSGPTDIAYAPAGSRLILRGATGDRVALAFARVPETAPEQSFTYLPASAVPVELRGAGTCSREVRNFGVPAVLGASSIIACEVLTPAGNWSSYPPHRHDHERPGEETELEEIYYFETRTAGGVDRPGADPVGYQRVYAGDDRPIDVFAEVRTGDVVLVPYGWHGPSMAAPGYDLYYLNVMAGPGPVRAWLICDDPAHSWVRGTWTDQDHDPRLPFGGEPV